MIAYLIYGLCILLILMGTVILGLLVFKIMDIVIYIKNKLLDLIFGKEKR